MTTIQTLVDRFLTWKLPATVRPDGLFGDPQLHQYLSGTNLLSAEEARLMFEHVLKGPTPLDVTLTKDEAEYIAAFISDDSAQGDAVVRLLVGDGHSGYGLYAAHPEYPEEGAVLVKSLPTPSGVEGTR